MNATLVYNRIVETIVQQIVSGVLHAGDRLPSLREICKQYGVSMNTATRAFYELEKQGFIESKPRSGYFVAVSPVHRRSIPSVNKLVQTHVRLTQEEVVNAMVSNFDQAKVALSSAMLDAALVPVKRINKALLMATQTLDDSGVGYRRTGGGRLKTQIAKRTVSWGGHLTADDLVTTAGSVDAIAFCLMALTTRGDTIAVESPVYFGILRLAHSLGLQVIEIPTHPITGADPDAIKKLLERKAIKLCILVTNFSNPLGSCMPDEHKKEVASLMTRYNVPLIEDDLYGDLYYGNQRPKTCKTYDESGHVLWCGSFSKTLVSGYRVGWLAPGKYKQQVERIKLYHTLQCSTITHEAVGLFLEMGRYEHHLRTVRPILQGNYFQFLRCINAYFPEQAKVTRPLGGMNLWVEFERGFNTLELYNRAIQKGISITPGRSYTLRNQYNNCLKLSYGMLWRPEVEKALKVLGKLARDLSCG